MNANSTTSDLKATMLKNSLTEEQKVELGIQPREENATIKFYSP